MTKTEALWDMERRLWMGGLDVYEQSMGADCVMVFPAPAGILTRAEILDALKQAPRWDNVEFDQTHISQHDTDLVTLAYRAFGSKDTETYEAFCSSTYRHDGETWLIVQHQQTPLG